MYRISLTLIIILSGCLPALAQTSYPVEHRQWEGTVFGGASFLGDDHFSTQVSGSSSETSRDVGISYASGYQVGLRLMEHLGEIWGADIEYSFANQPLRFQNLTPTIPSLALSHSVHHWSFSVSTLPLNSRHRFRPYGKFGMGSTLYYIHESSKNEALTQGVGLRDSWKYTVNMGGGFKYLVVDRFALTFDARDNISGIPSYGLPPSARVVGGRYQPGFARDGLHNNWQLSLGASFQFDDD